MNTLYYGDNLDILKKYIKDETVDLINLDPPFKSGKNYNQIFQPEDFDVKGATSQIQAFEDTWKWGPEAVQEGSFDYCYQEGAIIKRIPKIQLLTVEDLFTDPISIKLPPGVIEPYRKPDIKKDNGQQTLLM